MNIGYLIYQAERPRTAAERRADDVRRGELAKALSQVLRGRRRDAAPVQPVQPVRPALALVREPAVSTAGTAPTSCACECRTAS
jgi:hypothetical protein